MRFISSQLYWLFCTIDFIYTLFSLNQPNLRYCGPPNNVFEEFFTNEGKVYGEQENSSRCNFFTSLLILIIVPVYSLAAHTQCTHVPSHNSFCYQLWELRCLLFTLEFLLLQWSDYQTVENTKSSLQWPKLTKPGCLTDFMYAFYKLTGEGSWNCLVKLALNSGMISLCREPISSICAELQTACMLCSHRSLSHICWR